MSELTGKVALVTGGSRGIGRAIAEALAGAGARVAVVARDVERATAAAAELPGGPHAGFSCDVADPAAVNATLAAVEERLGPADILVNNAGITRDNLLLRMKDEEFDEVIAANLKGAFNFTRAVSRGMMKRRDGAILNITSVVGLIGNAGQANYAASKAGLIGMTKALALEIASRGITVNCIAPGFVTTAMTGALTEEQRSKAAAAVPAGRFGTPAEVAAAAVYLASDEAAYVTGHTLHVNGGIAMV